MVSAAAFQENQRIQLLKETAIKILDETEFTVGDLVRETGSPAKYRVLHGQKSSAGKISVIVIENDVKTKALRAFRPERLKKIKGGENEMPRSKTKATTSRKASTRSKGSKECLCGCGGQTAGGRFLPGHDARLKSQLVKSAQDGRGRDKAVAKLKELGWESYIPSANGRTKPKPKSRKATTGRRKAKA